MQDECIRLATLLHCRVCEDVWQQCCRSRHDFTLVYRDNRLPDEPASIVRAQPHVLALDLDLQGDTLAVIGSVRAAAPQVRIACLSSKWTDLLLRAALNAAADGLLAKSEPVERLFGHFRAVALGQRHFSEELRERVIYDPQRGQYRLTSNGPFSSFTSLQLEILRLIALGDSLKMIARKLKLSRKSVDGHKYRIMRKLGVNDRVLLSHLAIREGLINP